MAEEKVKVHISFQSAPAFGNEKTHQDVRVYTGTPQKPLYAGTMRLTNAEWNYLNKLVIEGHKAVKAKEKLTEVSTGDGKKVTIN